MANILVVDDEQGIRDLLAEILGDEGHSVDTAENAAQARQARGAQHYDLVLLDIWMPDTDGITLLKEWCAAEPPGGPVIMMSGHASIETAVEATRIGALTFLEKPITLQKLLLAVELALEHPAPAPEEEAPPEAGAHAAADLAPEEAPAPEENHLPPPQQCFDLNIGLRPAREAFERAYFEYHLAHEGGSMTRVAEKTGLERTHLYRKLRQLGIDLACVRRGGK